MQLPSPYDRLLMPVYLPSFIMSVSQMALLILLPLYVLELGYGPVLASLVMGLRGIGLLLFDLPAGMLVTRFGDKPVLLTGLGLTLAGTLLLAATPHPLILSVAAVILGAGFSAWMLGRQSYIADTCKPDEVGRAIALMAGLQRAGSFIGPAAGGVMAQFAGYPLTFVVAAASAVAAAIFVASFMRNVKHDTGESHEFPAGTLSVLRSHRKVFATAGFAAFALQVMRAARQLLVPLVGAALGLDSVQIGAIYSLSAAVDMCLFYPVGVLVDRRGRKWSAVPSMALFAIGLALLSTAGGFESLLAVSLLLGVANGLSAGIVLIIGADLARQSGQRGQFLGLWRFIGDVGMTASPMLTSVLIGAASLAAASVSAAGIGIAGTLVMILLVPETLRKGPYGRSGPGACGDSQDR
ncbi:MFS transporter [Candidatus Rariloculus sp.]|uniref:MFS transporter n=1 Tax=Candidatus Rariloculus sp. TaxID=3101265 RepID=UPI003D10EF42